MKTMKDILDGLLEHGVVKTCRCGAQHDRLDRLCLDCRTAENVKNRARALKGHRVRRRMMVARGA